MSYSSKSLFSVAKFTIEGVSEGAEHINSAPPRLTSTQTTPDIKLQQIFPINPFSLSRSSFPNSHTSLSSPSVISNAPVPPASPSCTTYSSQNSVNTHYSPSVSMHVSSVPSSSHIHILFPNPFLIKQNSDLQPAPLATQRSSINILSPPKSQIPVKHNQKPYIPSALSSQVLSASHRKPRKPQPDRVLATSTFRPQVMAVDRIFSWRTPYGLAHDASLLAELPPDLVESAKMSITGALATSSRSTYAAGLLRFNQFCDRWEISEGARMPASYALLCAFIGNYKGSISGKTIKSWLSGVRAWHLTNHAPWYGDDKWVQMARISANKEGSRHKRPLRAPVSIEHLLALRRAITPSNHFHAAIWAVALVTFFGCRRLGETTVSSTSSFNPNFHVLRSSTYVYISALLFLLTMLL
jgi:hypothetical protein